MTELMLRYPGLYIIFPQARALLLKTRDGDAHILAAWSIFVKSFCKIACGGHGK